LKLKKGEFEQVCMIVPEHDLSYESLNVSSAVDLSVDPKNKAELGSQTWESAMQSALQSPVGDVISEFSDLFPEKVPSELPKDRGIRHEIDLVSGTKYCVTRQWPYLAIKLRLSILSLSPALLQDKFVRASLLTVVRLFVLKSLLADGA
jgi:hypothetical protein